MIGKRRFSIDSAPAAAAATLAVHPIEQWEKHINVSIGPRSKKKKCLKNRRQSNDGGGGVFGRGRETHRKFELDSHD